MHLGIAECHHIQVTVTLTSEIVLRTIELWSTSLIFFEVGIPNLVCKCILDAIPFHFLVTVTLTSDLVPRICVKSGAKLLYSLR